MTANGILQILLFFALVLLATKPLGAYMARVFNGERTLLSPVLRPVRLRRLRELQSYALMSSPFP